MDRRLGVITGIALLAVALAPASLASAAPKWKKLGGAEVSTNEVGLARLPDGKLAVAYRHGTGATAAVHSALLSKKGKKISETDIVGGWTTINASVELAYSPGGGPGGTLIAYWGGLRSTDPGEKLDGELVAATSVTGGAGWSGPFAAAQNATKAYVASGIGAAADPSGAPVTVGAWGDSGPDDNGYSFGSGPSPNLATGGGGGLLQPEVAIDRKGSVFGAWQSIAAGNSGIFARELAANGPLGAPIYAPGSSLHNRTDFDFQLERTALAARPGKPGFWVAYGKGSPSANKILLWKVGKAKAKLLVRGKKAKGAGNISIAPASGHRLWVFWSKGKSYFATRTNKAATKAGKIRKLKAPGGTTGTYRLAGEGTGGKKLDLFAHVARKGGAFTYHAQVKP